MHHTDQSNATQLTRIFANWHLKGCWLPKNDSAIGLRSWYAWSNTCAVSIGKHSNDQAL
jgi:hypothetical protein